MNNVLLVTRPNHDETTNYLYYWAKKIIVEAEKKNFRVLDLEGKKANPKDFSGRVNKVNPDIVFLNGHGSLDVIMGHDNIPLISVNDNESLLSNCITYALACSAAKKIGKSIVKAGSNSFIGYSEDFIFLHQIDKTTRPLEDKTAALFFEPSNLIVSSIIKRHSAKEATEKSKSLFKRNLRRLMTSESPQEDKSAITWLYWDMAHLECLGNGSATI